jgi:hypothetical protein
MDGTHPRPAGDDHVHSYAYRHSSRARPRPPHPDAHAAYLVGSGRSDVLIGLDDDNQNDLEIQPAGTAANQSLNNTTR